MKLIDALILVLFGHAGVWSHFADVESNPQIIDRTNTETSIKDQNSRDLLDRLFENLLNNEAEKEAVEALNEDALLKEADLTDADEEKELDSALLENEGKWLDNPITFEEELPANYQNVTKTTIEIGGKKYNIEESVDKTSSDDGKSTYFAELIEAEPAKRGTEAECSINKSCRDDQYCFETDFTSVCLTCQKLGTECLDDAQCCASDSSLPICVNGVCAAGIQPGSAGTICKSEDDCLPGLCCAQSVDFPRRLCRRYSRLNEQCSPLDYRASNAAFEGVKYFCPCESHLACTAEKPNTLYDYLALKYDFVYSCSATKERKDPYQPREKPVARNIAEAPASGRDIVDLYNRLWQLRAKSMDDQE